MSMFERKATGEAGTCRLTRRGLFAGLLASRPGAFG
jgi:hypothetical protein